VEARGEEDTGAKRFLVGLLGRKRFVEFGPRLAAGAHFGAGFKAETRVAGGIEEQRGGDAVDVFASVAAGQDLVDPAAFIVAE